MELIYVTPTVDAMRVPIATEPRFVASEPELLGHLSELHLVDFEPLPDGRWVAIQEGPEEYATARFNVIQNWHLELEQKLDVGQ